MHGTGKSDSLKVPAKPVNNAERSVAESVEESGGTKRNAVLQSTVRTQSRDAVTQARDRIRGAIKQNRERKFTALLHHVNVNAADAIPRTAFSQSGGRDPRTASIDTPQVLGFVLGPQQRQRHLVIRHRPVRATVTDRRTG